MNRLDENGVRYVWRNRMSLSESELDACSNLFSNHYGSWSITSPYKPGEPIKLNTARIEELMAPDGTSALLAYHNGDLIGHAFALRDAVNGYGFVSWVTQLVVHNGWRHQGVATRLLNSAWAFSNDYAWGLVTANPYTVRTLEKATRRRCYPSNILKSVEVLKKAGSRINYVRGYDFDVTSSHSKIDTKFHIDHKDLKVMLKHVNQRKWRLGKLKEGEEWLAFTFKRQPQSKLKEEELTEVIQDSERILLEAYDRMTLDKGHRWAQHAEAECEFILKSLPSQALMRVVDFGCGTGRHVIPFARRGHSVTGVDMLPQTLHEATKLALREQLPRAQFVEGDCRNVNLDEKFDLGICLYDVIGSYADDSDNRKILSNLAGHIRPGGFLVISVMNMELTEHIARNRGSVFDNPKLLQSLEPADIMQTTGDVFDPKHFLIDTKSGVVFRKEQFSEDGLLSSELVVRDRRYRLKEVLDMCSAEGFEPLTHGFVQAGAWGKYLQPTDSKAKEILFIGKKRT